MATLIEENAVNEKNTGLGGGVYISTYGCQMNVNDSERMLSLLEQMNYYPVTTPEKAALIIINSCSVREKPVHKVHSEVGQYKILKRKNPSLKLGVAGCVAQQEKKKLLKDLPVLDFVFGPDNIDELPTTLEQVMRGNRTVQAKFSHGEKYSVSTLVRNPGVSTFVNITKGCDNFCTFCVVPFTRGRERSRSLRQLVMDIESLVKRDVKEVTLLGQNVNSYRSECGARFPDLLQALCENTGIKRIRYTTSHPKDFDQDLVSVSQKYRRIICDYVHLPVQSGSTEVLLRMNRGYSREEYLEKVAMIREGIPGVSLSTDIIVGFPGENEAQYEDTLSLLEEVGYENIFAFKYSPRPFTKAARFTNQVNEDVKKSRLERLFTLQDRISKDLASFYLDRSLEVLVEGRDEKYPDRWKGRSSQNKIVYFESPRNLRGHLVSVKVTKARPNVLYGNLC